MKGYLEAYRERMEMNHNDLMQLAEDVKKLDPEIEIYTTETDKKFKSSLVFIKNETVNTIRFHEVPYRWSGCGYGEFHNHNNTLEMPFTPEQVLSTMKPIKGIGKSQTESFKDKEHYLKWNSYFQKL